MTSNSGWRFQFWWNCLTRHQTPYVRTLSTRAEVTVACECLLKKERSALGWDAGEVEAIRLIVDPSAAEVRTLAHSDKSTIHLLEGYGSCRLSREALGYLARSSRVGVISESGNYVGALGPLRRAKSMLNVRRWAGIVQFILAMGSMGEDWYIQCGARQEQVFPFCYVVDTPTTFAEEERERRVEQEFRIMYLGQLIHRKGIDLLLHALRENVRRDWRADLVGCGPMAEQYQQLSENFGLSSKVHFHSAKANQAAMRMLAQADLLVLPSRFDGWGAVVNEALMRGVPVICTTTCGASDLIRQRWLGTVVKAGCAEELGDALACRIQRGPLSESERARVREWAQCIDGRVVGDYFLRVMEHLYQGAVRPTPPWRSAQGT